MNLGKKIDELHSTRESIRDLEKEVKGFNETKAQLEVQIMEHMLQQELDKASGSLATVSLTESVVPAVKDWDAFLTYIHRHKAYHLLQRRAAVPAYREELELRKGKGVPGVDTFNKSNLSVRSRT